jgi:hypothetical protein
MRTPSTCGRKGRSRSVPQTPGTSRAKTSHWVRRAGFRAGVLSSGTTATAMPACSKLWSSSSLNFVDAQFTRGKGDSDGQRRI